MSQKGEPLLDRQWKWKGEAANPDAKRNRAQRWFPIEGQTCEHCQQSLAILSP